MAFDELDLTGMEIEPISWAGDRLQVSYGGGYGDAAVVGPASGLWGWEISSDCLPDAASYGSEIDGDPRFEYYFNFIKEHITGDTEIFLIEFRGKFYHASFAENTLQGVMHTYDLFGLSGVKIRQRRVVGESYNSDGSVSIPDVETFYLLNDSSDHLTNDGGDRLTSQ